VLSVANVTDKVAEFRYILKPPLFGHIRAPSSVSFPVLKRLSQQSGRRTAFFFFCLKEIEYAILGNT
jgi:hypothetical protein